MRPETIDAIMKALATHPEGLTAKEMGPLIDCAPITASQRMGKLHTEGVIERTNIAPYWRGRPEYRYRIPLPKVAAPPAADVESPSVALQPAQVE